MLVRLGQAKHILLGTASYLVTSETAAVPAGTTFDFSLMFSLAGIIIRMMLSCGSFERYWIRANPQELAAEVCASWLHAGNRTGLKLVRIGPFMIAVYLAVFSTASLDSIWLMLFQNLSACWIRS